MGYTYSFFDNQTIGADELNKLTKRFVTGGIADVFQNGVPYNISVLNNIASANVTEGVVPDTVSSLKVYISGNNIIVSAGSCFFENGTYMEVDASGITLSFIPNETNYIYLISDAIAGECRCENKTTPLSTGVYILLAIVDKNKNVTDKRLFARGKIPSAYASSYSLTSSFSVTWTYEEMNNKITKEIPLSSQTIRGLFCEASDISIDTKTFSFVTFDSLGNPNKYYSGCTLDSDCISGTTKFSTSSIIIYNDIYYSMLLIVTAKISDGKLILTPVQSYSNKQKNITANFFVF